MGPRVGIIGPGTIGQLIAERIAASGISLAEYDVRPHPVAVILAVGAQGCRCAAGGAGSSYNVISLVLDEKQTREVLAGGDGAAPALGSGPLAAIGSTLGPNPVLRYARAQQACAASPRGAGPDDRGRWHCNRTRRPEPLSHAAR